MGIKLVNWLRAFKMSFIFRLLLVTFLIVKSLSFRKDEYNCSYCIACLEDNEGFCHLIQNPPKSVEYDKAPRRTCIKSGHCLKEDETNIHSVDEIDIRISKAVGRKGYNKIRISAISTNSSIVSKFFTYSQPFQYRWTEKILNTGEISLSVGINRIEIAGQSFEVFLPAEGEAVRGVMMADPCFQSEW